MKTIHAMAVISENCPETVKEHLSETFFTIALPPDPILALPVASHPDMLITILDGALFCHRDYYAVASQELQDIARMCNLRLICSSQLRSSKYPADVGLNALVLTKEQKLIARGNSIIPELLPYLAGDTNQGYAGCSSLYINGTILTADPSICRTAKQCNIPIYMLPAGSIQLPGYNTGFIGGCGGVWRDTIYLFGTADSCNPGRALKKYCQNTGLSIVELMDGPLTDFGGIRFIEMSKPLYM